VLHLGSKNVKHEYRMNRALLKSTIEEKDLGVIMDPDLSFDAHINGVVKKANRLTGMVIGNIHCKEKCIMVPIFKTLVRPILEYGNAAHHPSGKCTKKFY
jgi:hypothetical protein